MEAIVIGDLHLGCLKSFYPENDLAPIFQCYNYAIDYAKRNGIPNIIFLGDLFHTPYPSQRDIQLFLEQNEKFANSKLKFHYILGNHDIGNIKEHSSKLVSWVSSRMGCLKNVFIYEKPTLVEIEDIKTMFLPFPYTECEEKKPCFVVAHFEKHGTRLDNGMLGKSNIKLNPRHKYVLGHIHTYTEGDVYPGSVVQTNFGESCEKGFFHILANMQEKELEIDYKWVPLPSVFKLVNLKIETLDDLQNLKKDPNIFYKLWLHSDVGALPDDVLTSFPNIKRVTGFKNKKELIALQKHQLLLESDSDSLQLFNHKAHLRKYLKEKGHTKTERKLALKIIDDVLKEICQST